MTHEVFISYSHHDKAIADGVCANLESAGIRCWIAPRDIAPGYDWPTAISEAIDQSRVLVLIFSSRSNSSKDVSRELILAANNNCIIVPFKIEDVPPEPGKKYYLARTHWLDAMDPPTQDQIDKLVSCVRAFLVEAGVPLAHKPSPEKKPVEDVVPHPPAIFQEKSVPVKEKRVEKPPRRKRTRVEWIIAGVVILVSLIVLGFKFIPSLTVQPISTPTLTSTLAPTLSPTHQPSITPTRTTRPSPTALPAWVSDFAQPIFLYAREDNVKLHDTFTGMFGWTADSGCAGFKPILTFEGGEMLVPGCVELNHFALDYPDFVLKMDARVLTDSPSDSSWEIAFRITTCPWCTLEIDTSGNVSIGGITGSESHTFPSAALPAGQINHVTMIAKRNQFAFFINDLPLDYVENDTFMWGGLNLEVHNPDNSKLNNPVLAISDLQLWDIYDLP